MKIIVQSKCCTSISAELKVENLCTRYVNFIVPFIHILKLYLGIEVVLFRPPLYVFVCISDTQRTREEEIRTIEFREGSKPNKQLRERNQVIIQLEV